MAGKQGGTQGHYKSFSRAVGPLFLASYNSVVFKVVPRAFPSHFLSKSPAD